MRTIARVAGRHGRELGTAVVAVAVLAGVVSPAGATLTTPACLAKKLREWGTLRQCQARENGRVLRGSPASPARCQTKFDARLATLNAEARSAAIPCRYRVNGDGTVTDFDTGLQWEQKTDDGSIHDRGNEFDWSPRLAGPDGTAFTSFLGALNNGTSRDGATSGGCFADHCDWRLPSIVELRSIVDLTVPGCGSGSPCIDEAAFGPTLAFFYWSATTETPFTGFAWGVTFFNGNVFSIVKEGPFFVRAVRSSL
jgi:hypothetical protein